MKTILQRIFLALITVAPIAAQTDVLTRNKAAGATQYDLVNGTFNVATGGTVTMKSGSTLTLNGAVNASPTGGTWDLSLVGLSINNAWINTTALILKGDWSTTGYFSPSKFTLGARTGYTGIGTEIWRDNNNLINHRNAANTATLTLVDTTSTQTLTGKSIDAGQLTGTIAAARMPALTGDVTTSAGAVATTLATVNSNVGTFGNATKSVTLTLDGKGRVTAVSEQTITPAVGSISGLGTGIASWLATPSSANLATALTDETGSGAAVFAASPTLITPTIGVASATSLAVAGTAGAGYIEFAPQASAPSAPASGLREYADSLGRRSWIRADGFTRTWDATLNANRIYTLPDASGTVLISANPANTTTTNLDSITATSATNLTMTGGSAGASLVLGQGASGGITATFAGDFNLNGGASDILYTVNSGKSLFLRTAQAATAGTTTRNSPSVILRGAYWNGSASANLDYQIVPTITAATPTSYLAWQYQGSTKMALTDAGNLLIGGTSDISGSGGLKVFGTTASTSTTTGSALFAGGVGVAGAAWIGDSSTITKSQDATTQLSVVNANVGTSAVAGITLTTASDSWKLYAYRNNDLFKLIHGSTDVLTFSTSNNATLVGDVILSGTNSVVFGSAASASIGITANTSAGVLTFTAPSSGSYNFQGSAKPVNISATTASTSTTTGALIVGGGVGIAGRVSGGGGFYVSDSNSFTRNSGDGSTYIDAPSGTTVALRVNGTSKLTVSGSETTLGTSLVLPTSTPASSSAAGTAGTITWDANYVYVCTATNTWKRAALSTW